MLLIRINSTVFSSLPFFNLPNERIIVGAELLKEKEKILTKSLNWISGSNGKISIEIIVKNDESKILSATNICTVFDML
jgi:hypothetical protein